MKLSELQINVSKFIAIILFGGFAFLISSFNPIEAFKFVLFVLIASFLLMIMEYLNKSQKKKK